MSACTGTPISWLRLERFHQGDVDGPEREAIAAHLDACAACRACLGSIEDDDRALPPLPAAPKKVRRPWYVLGGRTAAAAGALALAAVLLLLVRTKPRPSAEETVATPAASAARVKGDGVAFTLVRDDETIIGDAGGIYRDGDRFKALVTCPPGMRASWDVAVYERGEPAFPLSPSDGLECGNEVPMPGAFRLTGRERLDVCLVWSTEGPVDRDEVRRTPPAALATALCKTLTAAPP